MSSMQIKKTSRFKENLIGSLLALALAYSALYLIGPFSYLYMLVIPPITFSRPTLIQTLIWILLENIPDYLLTLLLTVVLGLYFLRFRMMRGNLPILVFILFSLLLKGFVLFDTYTGGINSLSERYALFGEAAAKVFSVSLAYLIWGFVKNGRKRE